MGIRLSILNWWTPGWVISRELDRVSQVTTAPLKKLLATYAPESQPREAKEKPQRFRSIEEKRFSMAAEHTALVEALAASVGREDALKLGRGALYEAGQRLGAETRRRLGVSNDPEDMIIAARILYRVLGIEFRMEWEDQTHATLVVNRCALAKRYSEFTCQILSATDEGVVKGLDPEADMAFQELMTSGCPNCRAKIKFAARQTS